MASIELKNICKRFSPEEKSRTGFLLNPFTALTHMMKSMQSEMTANVPFVMEDLSLTVPNGKTVVILGPSGCGKSTLLRIIGGLMSPDSGEVLYDNVDVSNVPPGERQIGMVFQNYALYPHFTSRTNLLSYFMFKKRTPELDHEAQERYQRTSEILGVEIEYLLDKMPTHLSGGEKQRVALGRCITRDPKLFLLDEPFSNLDQKLREKYRGQLKKLLRHFQITSVYVTHDQQEALLLADLLAVMNVGTIEQVGTPEEIYYQPNSMFVAEFLNFDTDTPAINLLDGGTIAQRFRDFVIGVRSEDIELCRGDESEQTLSGELTDIRHVSLKRSTVLSIKIGGQEMHAKVPRDDTLAMDEEIQLRFKKFHLFDKHTGLRVQSF